MSRTVLRFSLLAFFLIALLGAMPIGLAAAQDATPAADCPPLTQEDAEAWVAAFIEPLNSHDPTLLAGILAEDYVHHFGVGVDSKGADVFIQRNAELIAAFPTIHFTIEDVLLADDTVILRWIGIGVQETEFMGIPPSTETVTWTGITIARLECGLAVEGWAEADHFGRIRQQGVIPVAEATPEAA